MAIAETEQLSRMMTAAALSRAYGADQRMTATQSAVSVFEGRLA